MDISNLDKISRIYVDRMNQDNHVINIFSKKVKDIKFHEINDLFVTSNPSNPLLRLIQLYKFPEKEYCFILITNDGSGMVKPFECMLNIGWNVLSEGKKLPTEFSCQMSKLNKILNKSNMQVTESTHIKTLTVNTVLVSYNNQEYKFYVEILDLGTGKFVSEIRQDRINPRLRKSEKGKIKKMITNYYTERLNS